MKTNDRKDAQPVAAPSRANDWFFDELMTAQPEATRDFYRAQLLERTAKIERRK